MENVSLSKELLDVPYEDWEQPSIRFDINEDEDITKHLFYYKTDKVNSFSEKTEPKAKLMEALTEIQKLPMIENTDNANKERALKQFSNLMKTLIPHLMCFTKDNSNTIKLHNGTVSVEELNDLFKYASKSKRKAMINK